MLAFLNVYSVTRHYGGAEEGGWYYNRLEPLASVPVVLPTSTFDKFVMADEATRAMFDPQKEALERMFEGESHGDIYSVNGGVDVWCILEESFAKSAPKDGTQQYW